ncbi:MAG: hypothetical protein HC899_38135 [Leptolyngbyaceae cyanobacterium SM1_4_3]|nr:hypothetical protein [Leptolyngbyaceae cyanobacterium SM1_4_3]
MRLIPRSPDNSPVLLTTENSVEKIIEHHPKNENGVLYKLAFQVSAKNKLAVVVSFGCP